MTQPLFSDITEEQRILSAKQNIAAIEADLELRLTTKELKEVAEHRRAVSFRINECGTVAKLGAMLAILDFATRTNEEINR